MNGGVRATELKCGAMRRTALVLAWLFIAGWASAAQARAPVVVELFTSQGCSSCVAADKVLDQLADKPDILALTLAVDYWDYLGWSDTFAKPEFTARQRAYMQRLAHREVYTPQIVVNGGSEAAGADQAKIDALVDDASHARLKSPPIRLLRHARVSVGAGHPPKGGGEVWLVRYDPRAQEIAVKRGENRGQTLVQRNVVRELVRLGAWRGKARIYTVPAAAEKGELKTCVLLQAADGGRILGVALK